MSFSALADDRSLSSSPVPSAGSSPLAMLNNTKVVKMFAGQPQTPESLGPEDLSAQAAAAAGVTVAAVAAVAAVTAGAVISAGGANNNHCYRHRPDARAQRDSDEAKMLSLQTEMHSLPSADQASIEHIWSVFGTAPARHRHLILQGLITKCCFPQLSAISREVKEQLRIDFLSALPVEISERILGFLDTGSLCRASRVSQWWRELADADRVWRRMCEQHIDRKCTKCGWGLPLLEPKRLGLRPAPLSRSQNQIQTQTQTQTQAQARVRTPDSRKPRPHVDATESRPGSRKRPAACADDEEGDERTVTAAGTREGQGQGEGQRQAAADADADDAPRHLAKRPCALSPKARRPWKHVYRDRWRVGSNWKYGRCHMQRFTGHGGAVTCLQFEGDVLATGSDDATIKIWNTHTGAEIRTLRGHTLPIRALQFDDAKLISGGADATIRVWNWHTGECVCTLGGHAGPITTLHFNGSSLASGSLDGTVKLFNFETRQAFCLRSGRRAAVNHLRIDPASRTVFSASDDLVVRLWDLDTRACLRTYDGHVGPVRQVLLMPDDFEPDEVAEAGRRGAADCGRDERALYGDAFASDAARPLPPRYMLTLALDNTVRVWDTATGRCLRNTYVEGAGSLVGDTLRVLTGGRDSEVRVWEPRAGKCERSFAGHVGAVTAMGLGDSRMASGGQDGEVLLYSFDHQGKQLVGEC